MLWLEILGAMWFLRVLGGLLVSVVSVVLLSVRVACRLGLFVARVSMKIGRRSCRFRWRRYKARQTPRVIHSAVRHGPSHRPDDALPAVGNPEFTGDSACQ